MTQRGGVDGQLGPEEVRGPIAFAPDSKAQEAGAAAPGPCRGGNHRQEIFSQIPQRLPPIRIIHKRQVLL